MVAHAAFANGNLKSNWQIIKGYRFRHFITTLPVLALVVAVGTVLVYNIPFMDKNPFLWVLSLFTGSGDGHGSGNILFSGLQWKWYALIFLPVLLYALPALAKIEELQFRQDTRSWSQGIARSIKFGLVHVFALIPLGYALALSIGGLWFTHQYFKGGVARSTTYHSMYNSILVATLFAIVLLPE